MSASFSNLHKKISLFQEISKQPLKIQAVVTCYNEGDIIGQTIDYLIEQGIHVHIIDNWSTDSSWDIILDKQSCSEIVTVERFPKNGPSSTYDWTKILSRVEQHAVAHAERFDWFIHHDADEVRESPFNNKSLRYGLEVVDAAGYNAINHTVINFAPIPETGFNKNQNPQEFFKYYQFGEGMALDRQIKAWKSQKTIDLTSTGGHHVQFADQKVFPYNFLLRHYPLRSKEQAMRKVFKDRKERWNQEERAKDWHKHYDHIQAETDLSWDPDDYLLFDDAFYEQYFIERIYGSHRPQPLLKRLGKKLLRILSIQKTTG